MAEGIVFTCSGKDCEIADHCNLQFFVKGEATPQNCPVTGNPAGWMDTGDKVLQKK